MAKKKSVGGIVFVMFLRSFIVVVLMLVIGLGSYAITMKYYEVSDTGENAGNGLDIVGDVTADEISRNLIYSVNPETSKIEAMVIEVLNTQTNNLDYITIPATIQFTISNEMYKRLYAAGADAPQIIQLANINEYFDNKTSYEYGILLLEDYLGIDIGYYSKMDSDVFNEYFTKAEDNDWYVVNDSLINEASSANDESSMKDFIKEKYNSLESNVSLKIKQKYAECFSKVDASLIYYHVLDGRYENGLFSADTKVAAKAYQTILLDSAHTTPQGAVANIKSEGLKIKILNGSGGNGIATAAKEKFVENGLNVVKIADNPEVIPKTMIYVKEDGMGKDLLYYFNDADIEVKELEEGIDIMVIVGATDVDIASKE